MEKLIFGEQTTVLNRNSPWARNEKIRSYWKNCPLTWILFSIFIITQVTHILVRSIFGEQRADDLFLFNEDWTHHFWTILTSNIAHHLDIYGHFEFNTLALILLMPVIERFFGLSRSLIAFLLIATLASFLKLYVTGIASIGASNGILAMGGMGVPMAVYRFSSKFHPDWVERTKRILAAGTGGLFALGMFLPPIALSFGHIGHWFGFFCGCVLGIIYFLQPSVKS